MVQKLLEDQDVVNLLIKVYIGMVFNVMAILYYTNNKSMLLNQ